LVGHSSGANKRAALALTARKDYSCGQAFREQHLASKRHCARLQGPPDCSASLRTARAEALSRRVAADTSLAGNHRRPI